MSDLQLDRALLDAMFQLPDISLAVVDAEKRYVRVSEGFAAMNGPSVREHLGRTPLEVLPVIGESIMGVLDHVLTTKLPLTDLEVEAPNADRRREGESVRVSIYPLLDEGIAVGVLAVALRP